MWKSFFRYIAGFDESYENLKELWREAWKRDFNFFCSDSFKRRRKDFILFVRKTKTHTLIAPLKHNPFKVATQPSQRKPKAAHKCISWDSAELCDELNLLLQYREAGKISDMINVETVTLTEKI